MKAPKISQTVRILRPRILNQHLRPNKRNIRPEQEDKGGNSWEYSLTEKINQLSVTFAKHRLETLWWQTPCEKIANGHNENEGNMMDFEELEEHL